LADPIMTVRSVVPVPSLRGAQATKQSRNHRKSGLPRFRSQ
jgi:hypothetical protein